MDRPGPRERAVDVHGRGRVSEQLVEHGQLRGARAMSDITQVLPARGPEDRVDLADGHGVGAAVRKAVGHREQHVRRLAVPQRPLLGRENRRSLEPEDHQTDGQRDGKESR